MKSLKYALLIAICATGSAFAQDEIPKIVLDGLSNLQAYGGKAAVETWVKGSALEQDNGSITALISLFGNTDTSYGKMLGYEKIRVVNLAPSERRIYLLIKYEKGPLFASFDCYKPQREWIIPAMDINPKASAILPGNILSGN